VLLRGGVGEIAGGSEEAVSDIAGGGGGAPLLERAGLGGSSKMGVVVVCGVASGNMSCGPGADIGSGSAPHQRLFSVPFSSAGNVVGVVESGVCGRRYGEVVADR
jgi:hypothetical protein